MKTRLSLAAAATLAAVVLFTVGAQGKLPLPLWDTFLSLAIPSFVSPFI